MPKLINVADYRASAQRRIPRFAWDAIEGGAGDEITLARNESAFRDYVFRPRALADVSRRDLATTVLGTAISLPVILGPVGAGRLVKDDAEHMAARAAASSGTIYCLSSVARAPEELSETSSGPKWFQLYIKPRREQTERLVRRALAQDFGVLCVTVDGAVPALRERDIRNEMKPPVNPRARLLLQGAMHPLWAANFLNLRRRLGLGAGRRDANPAQTSLRDVEEEISDVWHPISWDDLAWLRDLWSGPLVVKGIMRADECSRLVGLGVDGIVVSNHGGRQLDGVSATIEALPEVVAAVGGKAEVYLDGGIRRGSDVVKAIALGATAVLIGRPYIYGLAVGGQRGVERVVSILRNEIDNTMALLGCASVADIDSSLVGAVRDRFTTSASTDRPRPRSSGADGGRETRSATPASR